jgi:hypothetical protein
MQQLDMILARGQGSSLSTDRHQSKDKAPEGSICVRLPKRGASTMTTSTPAAFNTQITPKFFLYKCINKVSA